MDNEKYFIRKLAKILDEDVDKYYWFNFEKYFQLASKYDLNSNRLEKAVQEAEGDEEKQVSYKTIARVLGYYNGEKEGKGNGNKAVTIDTAKALGKALCNGDEYGLLIKIEPSSVLMVMKEAEDMWGTGDLNYIYGLMNNLLYELELSSFYSYKPGTREDGFEYYNMRLQSIRKEIDRHFWNKKITRDKLYRLVDEEEELIKSYSQPGAPVRWIEANPNLKYYDCVFDFIEESPEIYQKIKNGNITTYWGQTVSFIFYPTEEECADRKAYFADLEIKNIKQNGKYTEERFYQNELVEAFRRVFEMDFT